MYLASQCQEPDSQPAPDSTCAPDLRFASNGLLPPPADRHILVAVSGGSDSMALLRLLADWQGRSGCVLSVATVDHGLRQGSAAEARFVAETCRTLALHHTVLNWHRKDGDARSSSAARGARYALLHGHAKTLGASAIALGHTRDDQAETVTMRAARLNTPARTTNGLAGMGTRTGLVVNGKSIDLYRPLLGLSRNRLRAYLNQLGQGWRNDPTNVDPGFERVRIRANLARQTGPTSAQRARLATTCGRSRLWLATQTADYLASHASCYAREGESAIHLSLAPRTIRPVAENALAAIIRRMGHNAHPVSVEKLWPVFHAIEQNKTMRHTLGRCLLTIRQDNISIQPEHRTGRPVAPLDIRYAPPFDAPLDRVLDRLFARSQASTINP